MSTDGHCARRNRQPDATSEPGEFSRVESNQAAGSTPGALPSVASCFRLATILLPEPGTVISQLDPSWFGLRPFPKSRIGD